eukprot:1990193-Rhodomonas_salina.3
MLCLRWMHVHPVQILGHNHAPLELPLEVSLLGTLDTAVAVATELCARKYTWARAAIARKWGGETGKHGQ